MKHGFYLWYIVGKGQRAHACYVPLGWSTPALTAACGIGPRTQPAGSSASRCRKCQRRVEGDAA